jgi:hypothetical protein
MSEFQYYEWQTVDRVLNPAEQAAVNRLSSHIEVSPGKAVVTYNWSDFRHDPKEVLLKYFDAFFYYANWGSLRLMFRFPKGLINEKDLEPFWDGEYVSFETYGDYQVLDIDFNPEDGGWMDEAVVDLSDFISLRADLLKGDYRLLYLTWLKEMAFDDEDEDEQDEEEDGHSDNLEPPIPAGLNKLSPALQTIVDVFDIDPFLVQAAAEASPDLRETPEIDYRQLIPRLTRPECDDFLTRLAARDAAVGMALRKRLGEFLPHNQALQAAGKRKLEELHRRARQLEEAEDKRQTEEALRKHIAEMKDLAQRENQVWLQVDQLLENGRKIASVYAAATALLESLQDLAEFQGTREIFLSRVQKLAEKFALRPSLIKRWEQRGWV